MKKILLILVLSLFFMSCSNEKEDNNESMDILKEIMQNDDENESSNKEQNLTKNKKYDELIEFKSKEKDLNYLFEDGKFPVDDYVLMGGKKKPRQNVYEAFNETKKGQESIDDIKKQQENEEK